MECSSCAARPGKKKCGVTTSLFHLFPVIYLMFAAAGGGGSAPFFGMGGEGSCFVSSTVMAASVITMTYTNHTNVHSRDGTTTSKNERNSRRDDGTRRG